MSSKRRVTKMFNFSSTLNNCNCDQWKSSKAFEPIFQLNEFKHNGKTVKLFYPYTIIPEKIGNEYVFIDEKYNIYCCNTSINELLDDIKENIYMLYKMYVECDESELNAKAVDFRKTIENFIESVE